MFLKDAFILIIGKMVIPTCHPYASLLTNKQIRKLIWVGDSKLTNEHSHMTMWSTNSNHLSVESFTMFKMFCYNVESAIMLIIK